MTVTEIIERIEELIAECHEAQAALKKLLDERI